MVAGAKGVGLSVGGGNADVSEDTDLSEVADGESLGGYHGFVTGSRGVLESSEKTSQTVSHSFSISTAMWFCSARKKEVVNVV